MANWLGEINIFEKWIEADKDANKVQDLANDIIEKLDKTFTTKDEELNGIIAGLKTVPNDHDELNIWLEKLYNWGDEGHRLFVNWMFPKKE
jgi:hypothetical protein